MERTCPFSVETSTQTGEALIMHFKVSGRVFEFAYLPDPEIEAPTEVFIPNYQHPKGYEVSLSAGRFQKDLAAQTLHIYHPAGQKEQVILQVSPTY